MSDLVQYIIETTLILGVFLLIFEFILKSEKSFQYNRYFLIAAPLLALILPLLNIPFIGNFKSQESLGFVYELPTIVAGVTTFIEPAPQLVIPNWVWLIYFSGVAVLTIRILVQLTQLNEIITFAKKRIHAGDHTLVIARTPLPTFAFLHYIVIGSDKSIDEEAILHSLNHEKVHIKQRHTVDILIIEFLTIFLWFNPILYYYKRIIRENHEFIADQQASKDEPLAYSLALLKEMQKGLRNSIPNYFSMHFTKKRLRMIGNTKKPLGLLKPIFSLPFILLVFIAFSCQNEFLESKNEPVKIVQADFYLHAPPAFAKIMLDLKEVSPEKYFFFKIVDDIDLEIVKAQSNGVEIEYYQNVKMNDQFTRGFVKQSIQIIYKDGIGMIFSFTQGRQPAYLKFEFDEKIYTRFEATRMPEPWLGTQHLNQRIEDNTQSPQIEGSEDIHGTVWVRFTVNPYGNVINSRPLNHTLNTNDVGITDKFYGKALTVIGKLDGYYKPGEYQGNIVNVEMVLPVNF